MVELDWRTNDRDSLLPLPLVFSPLQHARRRWRDSTGEKVLIKDGYLNDSNLETSDGRPQMLMCFSILLLPMVPEGLISMVTGGGGYDDDSDFCKRTPIVLLSKD